MGLADWVNRYIVEVKPAEPRPAAPSKPSAPAPAPVPVPAEASFVPTQKRAADLLPAEPSAADPEIESLLAEARSTRPAPAPAVVAPTPAEVAPSTSASTSESDPLDDGAEPPVKVEQVYAVSKIGKPLHGFSLERIAGMLADPRLARLDEPARAAAVAVLLENAGVTIEKVVEDAVTRDQALDKFERFLEEKVEKVAAEVKDEDAKLEAEIERLLARKREQLALNATRVLEKQKELARFRRVKRAEEARLYEVVRPFTTDRNPVTLSGGPPAPPTPPPAPPPVDPASADTGQFKAPPKPPADPYEAMAAKLRREREGG